MLLKNITELSRVVLLLSYQSKVNNVQERRGLLQGGVHQKGRGHGPNRGEGYACLVIVGVYNMK